MIQTGFSSVACILIIALSLSECVHAQVSVALAQSHQRSHTPSVRLNTGRMSYDLSLYRPEEAQGPLDPDAFVLRSIGLFPSKRGWAGAGFLALEVGGKSVLPCPFKITAMKSGNTGEVVLRGESAAITVKLTFGAKAMGDVLLLSVETTLREPAETVDIVMSATPGEFSKVISSRGSPFGVADTRMLTPMREIGKEVKNRETGLLNLDKENWLLLYDANYDPQKNRLFGGECCACGVLYNPADVTSVIFEKQPTAITLRFILPGGPTDTRSHADFALWEFENSNEAAKRVMQSLVTYAERNKQTN